MSIIHQSELIQSGQPDSADIDHVIEMLIDLKAAAPKGSIVYLDGPINGDLFKRILSDGSETYDIVLY